MRKKKKDLNIFCISLWKIYICVYELDISTGTITLQRVYYLLRKFEKLPCFKKRKKNKSKCIVHLLQQRQRGPPADMESLRRCRLPPYHFYKCIKTCITTFCLLANEKIYMNLKIL